MSAHLPPTPQHNVPLATTLRLPCSANTRYVIETAADIAPVMQALHALTLANTPFKILGGGSNVLCAAPSIDTVLQVAIRGITLVRTEADCLIVQAGAGEPWHDLVMYTLRQGWLGLENLALIPGWVGASPVQNIGAYGVELCDRLHSVQAWDTRLNQAVSLAKADCAFAYRDSIFKHTAGRYVITHVTFSLPVPWQPVLHYGELAQQFGSDVVVQNPNRTAEENVALAQSIAAAVISIRQRKLPDPAITPNAGSFFKNPLVSNAVAVALKTQHPTLPCYPQANGHDTKLAAGWLIEAAGWKGHIRSGGSGGQVGVHAAQALVLVHLGGAQGADLLQLASDIQASVFERFGVPLEREVNVWSEDYARASLVMARVRSGTEAVYSSQQVRKNLGLND